MFTGIIEEIGVVESAEMTGSGLALVVAAPQWEYRARRGDSVCVSGVCLTAVEDADAGGRIRFDAIPETLARTTLGAVTVGVAVNLEHAARAMTLMGGHVVQGHVDAVAEVALVTTSGEWRVRLAVPATVMPFLAPKGSVCLDGVSLTLASIDVEAGCIEVAIIPVTLEKTTLGSWKAGRRVNIEADMMAKTVVHYLRHFLAK